MTTIYITNLKKGGKDVIEIPFCYKIFGMTQDKDGNLGYAYSKILMQCKRKAKQEEYDKLQEGYKQYLVEVTGISDVTPITAQEYLDEMMEEETESNIKILQSDFIEFEKD